MALNGPAALELEVRHLRLLVAIDAVGTLNAAAKKLHLTPSALSQQLRELEERLGGPLFHRHWRRLVVTAAGRRLTDAAVVLLRELERAEHEARVLLSGTAGTIRMATVCHQSYRWLPRLLKAFAERWPGVDVQIVPEAAESACDWLLERRLDVALVAGTARSKARLRLMPLFRDELVAVVGAGHPWFRRQRVDIAEIAEQHVWADDQAFRADSLLGRALAAAGGLCPRKLTVVPMTGTVPLEVARANLGITILPRWVVEPALGGGELHAVRFGRRGLWLPWSVATRAEEPEPALAAFLETLRRHHPRCGTQSPLGASSPASTAS